MTTPSKYVYRFLTAEQRTAIGKQVTTPAAATPPDDATQAAWEADLAAHQALLSVAKDDEAKARHAEAIKALETALTKAAART